MIRFSVNFYYGYECPDKDGKWRVKPATYDSLQIFETDISDLIAYIRKRVEDKLNGQTYRNIQIVVRDIEMTGIDF